MAAADAAEDLAKEIKATPARVANKAKEAVEKTVDKQLKLSLNMRTWRVAKNSGRHLL
jgi:hypothetical protein